MVGGASTSVHGEVEYCLLLWLIRVTDTLSINGILLIFFNMGPHCKWGSVGMFTPKNIVQCRDTWPDAKYISFGNMRCKTISSVRSLMLWWDCFWYPCCIRYLCSELPSQMSEFAGILKYLGFPVSLCAWGLIGLFSWKENNLPHCQVILFWVFCCP